MKLVLPGMIVLMLCSGRGLMAQEATPLEIEDVLEIWGFHLQGRPYAISPDGELAAYTACSPKAPHHQPPHGRGCVLFVTGTSAGSTAWRVLDGPGMTWGPSWSPDGRLLAFYSDRDGAPKAWLWDRVTGVATLLANSSAQSYYGYELAMWTPDGSTLIMHWPARDTGGVTWGGPQQAPSADDVGPAARVSVFMSPVPPTTGSAPAPAAAAGVDLVAVDVRTGAVRRLVTGLRISRNGWLSPDGRSVAILAATPLAPSETQARYHMHVVDVETGAVRRVSPATTEWFSVQVSWSPDSQRLAYGLAVAPGEEANGTPAGRAVFVVGAEGETISELRGAFTSPLWNGRDDELLLVQTAPRRQLVKYSLATGDTVQIPWNLTETLLGVVPGADATTVESAGGASWITVRTSDPRTRGNSLFRLNVRTGETLRVAGGGDGVMLSQPVVAGDGRRVSYIMNSAAQSGDLWLSDGPTTHRITTLNPQLERYRLGRSSLIDFRSTDNRDLRAALLLPPGYVEGARYPVVIWVYASEFGSANVHSFGLTDEPAFNMQMLATRGYVVLMPDMPVSIGTPLADMMKTVMPAIDRLVDLGIADPERLAIMGQSNGGYSVLGLLVQTGRFRAGVMNAGFGNLAALYGTMSASGRAGPWASWLEAQGGAMGAPPWETPLRYVENSPIFYLDRVTTPLLMQAGTADDVFTRQSDEIWVGLQRLGRNAIYLRYHGEGHVLRSPDNLADYWTRVTKFLREHMAVRD